MGVRKAGMRPRQWTLTIGARAYTITDVHNSGGLMFVNTLNVPVFREECIMGE